MANTQNIIKLTDRQIAKQVDSLGHYRKLLADTKARIAGIEEMLEANGIGEYMGREYTATVSYIDETLILDQAKAKSMLTPMQLSQCWKTREGYYKVATKQH